MQLKSAMAHSHRNEGITDHPCMEARATVQRWVLFQRDLTTKSAELGSATFDSTGFGTNCTVGSMASVLRACLPTETTYPCGRCLE